MGDSEIAFIVLMIHCHTANDLKTLWFKTIDVYYATVSVGQEFGSGSAGCLWLRVSHEIAVKVSAGPAVIEGLGWA